MDELIYGEKQKQLGLGDPATDLAVPDLIIKPVKGIIYTISNAKVAEHSGISDDDSHIVCFAYNSTLKRVFLMRMCLWGRQAEHWRMFGFGRN